MADEHHGNAERAPLLEQVLDVVDELLETLDMAARSTAAPEAALVERDDIATSVGERSANSLVATGVLAGTVDEQNRSSHPARLSIDGEAAAHHHGSLPR